MINTINNIALANEAKEQLLCALAKEGLLNGDPERIASQYVIVLYQKSWFGRLFARFHRLEDDQHYFAVLKDVSTGVPEVPELTPPTPLKVVPTPEKLDE